MTSRRTARELLPGSVAQVIEEFRSAFALDLHLWLPREDDTPFHLFPAGDGDSDPRPDSLLLAVPTRAGVELTLELRAPHQDATTAAARVLRTTLEHLYEAVEEIRFFTYEVSERYEEINLLYSIAETLGSLLRLEDAARLILGEVCEVMGARRGSIWAHQVEEDHLKLVASFGDRGLMGPIDLGNATAVTSQVFRDGRPIILTSGRFGSNGDAGAEPESRAGESVLSVPIRFTPPTGHPRTVGVINLIGRRRGGRFTASDQKLLAAIASQVGSALENHRLMRESVEQERVTREMELAHDLQMKLLPALESFDLDRVAARVQPAESVGGDFYHFFRLSEGRFGVMIGDVSSHGFPAALIMALALSAATIYASQFDSPEQVLTQMDQALRDELESTEMYLTLFYAVLDPERGEVVYANAGHPHAFLIRGDGTGERLSALNLPMGIGPGDAYEVARVPWVSGEDLLFLFTDGLSDTLLAASRTAAEARVVKTATRLRDRPAHEIVDALFEMDGGGAGLDGDDRTAIVLRL